MVLRRGDVKEGWYGARAENNVVFAVLEMPSRSQFSERPSRPMKRKRGKEQRVINALTSQGESPR